MEIQHIPSGKPARPPFIPATAGKHFPLSPSQRVNSFLFPFSFFLLLAACTPSPYRQGESLYKTQCASCHMDDGQGLRGVIPPLAGADYIAPDPAHMACIIRYGLKEEIVVNGIRYNEAMAGIPQLSEFQISNIINYINTSWGNDYGFVSMPEIRERLEACAE